MEETMMQMQRKKAYEKINDELSKYGEFIDPSMGYFRAYLVGTLDRLVYDEGKMSEEEARQIEALIGDIPDVPEEEEHIRSDGR
jgi:hypothetical protein